MSQIDFYILSNNDMEAKYLFACRIAEKAYKKNHNIIIRTENNELTQKINDQLWSFKDESFIPHKIIDDLNNASKKSIMITAPHQDKISDILINLSNSINKKSDQFKRIIEIVTNDNEAKKEARLRFKKYRDMGHEVLSHNI